MTVLALVHSAVTDWALRSTEFRALSVPLRVVGHEMYGHCILGDTHKLLYMGARSRTRGLEVHAPREVTGAKEVHQQSGHGRSKLRTERATVLIFTPAVLTVLALSAAQPGLQDVFS